MTEKITPEHRERRAIVYVRQSTADQVKLPPPARKGTTWLRA